MPPGSKKYGFSTKAFTAPTAEAGGAGTTTVSTAFVAPNPKNTRFIDPNGPQVLEIAESMRETGVQLEASAVTSRAAFLSIFPECEDEIGDAVFVQVTGGQRLAACILLGRDLEIAVKDELAQSRSKFLTATTDENIKRHKLNALEEALAVAQVVAEHQGNQSATARATGWQQPWISHRMNLLKLAPSVQALIREHNVPIREVRGSLHTLPEVQQLDFIQDWLRARSAITAVMAEPGETEPGETQQAAPATVPRQRASKVIRALRKLGAAPTPVEIGATLRAELPLEDRQALAAELLRES
jgi:ParB family transcriptional regulator, chromosome partitioning protein